MLGQALIKVRYALLLLKIGGPGVFLKQLGRQIFSTATYFGLEKSLEGETAPVVTGAPEYSLQPASPEDMEEILQKVGSEGKESAHELIQRKWFYESGFHNCYVARTTENADICLCAVHAETSLGVEMVATRAVHLTLIDAIAVAVALRNKQRTLENIRLNERLLLNLRY